MWDVRSEASYTHFISEVRPRLWAGSNTHSLICIVDKATPTHNTESPVCDSRNFGQAIFSYSSFMNSYTSAWTQLDISTAAKTALCHRSNSQNYFICKYHCKELHAHWNAKVICSSPNSPQFHFTESDNRTITSAWENRKKSEVIIEQHTGALYLSRQIYLVNNYVMLTAAARLDLIVHSESALDTKNSCLLGF